MVLHFSPQAIMKDVFIASFLLTINWSEGFYAHISIHILGGELTIDATIYGWNYEDPKLEASGNFCV